MGRGTIDIIDVEAKINSSNELTFRLDGKRFKFTK